MTEIKELNWEGFCRACGCNCFNTCENSKGIKKSIKSSTEILDMKVIVESLEWRMIELEKHLKLLSKTVNSLQSTLALGNQR